MIAVRCVLGVLGVLLSSGLTCGDETAREKSVLNTTINRGLTFLAKDALAWKTEHNCVSCHHAGLIVWAMREARQSGHAVDEPVLAELTNWIATSGDGKTGVPRPEGIPKALNEKAVSLALALAADSAPNTASQEGLKQLLTTVKSDQLDNGSWGSWPDTRAPLFGFSDERTTASATLALLPAATAGDEAAKTARDKGVQWLAATKTDDDPQSVALRLVLWRRIARPDAEWQPLVERIKARQNADGGWSQADEMPSDAWATGQALYALAEAGVKLPDAAIERGHRFLIATQREDGSWPMTSRPIKPGDKGATSLIPITGGGSSWAVLGLVRSH